MRIAVVNNFFPPRPGGSSHLAAALAARYVAAGHEVLVLTAAYRDSPAEEERDGYRVVRMPAMPMPQLGLAIDFDMAFTMARPGNRRRVNRLLDEFKPDVIHQHGQFFDLTWLSGWYARRRGVPVLLSVHTRLESPDPKYMAMFKALDRWLVKPILRRYRPRYVIMDELCGAYCEQRYGATKDEFEYLPVAVEPSRFEAPPTRDVRAEYEVNDAPLIVSLGHVIQLRDRLALVEGLPAILAKHPRTKVMVVGRVYYDAFLKRAEELGVSDAIISTGAVPPADVPSFFAAADIVAHDLQGGGFGTASLEAMAAGRATIGTITETNFPAVELRNWENFVLARPNDPKDLAAAVIRLLDEPQEREWIAKAQRELVHANFTLDVVARRHLDVFARMTAGR
ncbi:glycosyltransferase family 4 protein [Micromonospora sp. NPDC005367]|uniref:glycosyltransferase family 4 protein n=1 Tax=Micromonospora sp. NPDC005367 TaxID=3155590 RepID=UPI0033A8E182